MTPKPGEVYLVDLGMAEIRAAIRWALDLRGGHQRRIPNLSPEESMPCFCRRAR